ncbi:MAG: hypothetical protein DHS20C19_21950 [Acidimicrobiales bacterium]|nr:MAG: hypothetical protein DHS20C19_21950 [Acidimicrobiales bacterium]
MSDSAEHRLIRRLILNDRVWASIERLENLARLARDCEVDGAFVECGVAMGGCLSIMAGMAPDRTVWGFDSFAPMPELTSADNGDGEAFVGLNCSGTEGAGAVATTFAAAQVDMTNVRVVEGWFDETLAAAKAEIGDIAILRIDCDWYDATKLVLDVCHDAVVPGGTVIIDDYGSFAGCRKAVDEFRNVHQCGELHNSDSAEAYWHV